VVFVFIVQKIEEKWKMPKKYKNYSNFSTVCAPGRPLGHEEIWDDSELIDQFDQALREWKEERGGIVPEKEYETDTEEIPEIGPWEEVPVQKYNPETALESVCSFENAFPSINDLELVDLYDQALLEWREEREPENWNKHLENLAKEAEEAAAEKENSARLGPWVVVEDDGHCQTGNSSDSQEIAHDLEVVTIYDEALKEWKDERHLTHSEDHIDSSKENPSETKETNLET
jgi:hypothetical protein